MSDPASDWAEFAQIGQTPIVGTSSPATEPGSLLKDIQSALWGRLRESSEDDRNAAVEEIADRYEQEWQARLQAAEQRIAELEQQALARNAGYDNLFLSCESHRDRADANESAIVEALGERDRAIERVTELEHTVWGQSHARANAAEERVRQLTATLEAVRKMVTRPKRIQERPPFYIEGVTDTDATAALPATSDDDAERAAESAGS